MTAPISRRRLLTLMTTAAGSAVTLDLLTRAQPALAAGDAPAAAHVDEKDSMAVALGYVSDAKRIDARTNPQFQQGANCSGCSWYQGKAGDAAGACTFFPGKLVDAGGWCKMWNKKH
jgi:hypothetical protein